MTIPSQQIMLSHHSTCHPIKKYLRAFAFTPQVGTINVHSTSPGLPVQSSRSHPVHISRTPQRCCAGKSIMNHNGCFRSIICCTMSPQRKRQKMTSNVRNSEDSDSSARLKSSKARDDFKKSDSIKNSSKLTLAYLPCDALYEIAAHLPAFSLLCLSQTCASIRSAFHPDRANKLYYDALPAPVYLQRSRFVREDLDTCTKISAKRINNQGRSLSLGGPYNPTIDYKTEVRYRIHCRKLCCICLDANFTAYSFAGQPFRNLRWCLACIEHLIISELHFSSKLTLSTIPVWRASTCITTFPNCVYARNG